MSAAGSPGMSRRIANTRTDTARRTRARAATRRATKKSTMGALYPRPESGGNVLVMLRRQSIRGARRMGAALPRVTFGSHRTFRFDEAWSGRASSSAPERRPLEVREGGVLASRRSPRAVSEPEMAVFQILTTLAECSAILAAFVGVAGIFRIHVLLERRRDAESE